MGADAVAWAALAAVERGAASVAVWAVAVGKVVLQMLALKLVEIR
jgi:hypothetical protein